MGQPCTLLQLSPLGSWAVSKNHRNAPGGRNSTFVIVASGLEGVRAEMIGPERIWNVTYGTTLYAPTAISTWFLGGVEKSSKCAWGQKFDFCDCSERIGRCTSGDDWSRTHLECDLWDNLVRSYSYLHLVPGRCRKIIEMRLGAEIRLL